MARLTAVTIVATVIAAVATGCGRSASVEPTNLGAFASYVWKGEVRSVHAAWRVPEIQQGSPCGIAATWIGASAEGQGFLQIGTSEECVSPGRKAVGVLLNANYYTFWSDTAKGYHPRVFFRVSARDLIEATLALEQRTWRLTIVDASTGVKASFTTTDETQRRPHWAEWTQEDVELPTSYAAYPDLNEVRLDRVLVNGRPPAPELLEATGLSVDGGFLVPTPLHDDSFGIQRSK